jgi:hypothetical protein
LTALKELKARVLKLLKEDEEFRYAVAGLIGLEEVLKRLDRHEAELVRLREDVNRLREDMFKGFKRHDEEIVKLREDMIMGFKRYDEELVKLREDMNRGFELVERHISALGARWGVMAESAFREGLKGLLEREFGLRVEKWRAYDEAGLVFGYPSEVDLDVAVSDGRLILVEVSSHVRASDVFQFKRKAELYRDKTGREPDRLIVVAPYVDDKALEASKQPGVEVYTKV